jgi:hypothetical protein
MDIGSLFFALMLLILHPTLDQRIRKLKKTKCLPWHRPSHYNPTFRATRVETEAEIYFKQLAESWNK